MGGRIDCYIDIASAYSYLAFTYLIANLETLNAHGVEVEFHPVLLGALNAKTGNKPPWSLPAKAHYLGRFETPRAIVQFGQPGLRPPKDLMSMAHTILPLRSLHYIKKHYPRETYHAVLDHLFHKFWYPPNLNITQPDVLAEALTDSGHFSPTERDTILTAAKSQEVKDMLTKSTQDALDKGAFGAPWLWVTNSQGKAEPFFGSDRFHYVYKLLGLPYQDVQLLPPGVTSKL